MDDFEFKEDFFSNQYINFLDKDDTKKDLQNVFDDLLNINSINEDFKNIFDDLLNLNNKEMKKKRRQNRILIFNERKKLGKISYKNMKIKYYPQKIFLNKKIRDLNGRFFRNINREKFIPISQI